MHIYINYYTDVESTWLRAIASVALPQIDMSPPHAIRLVGGTLLVHDDNDNVEALANTDILLKDGKIAEIGKNIRPTPNTQVLDCRGKIIAPGFVDSHHHVWQTQLKGRHSDDTLLDYHPKGRHFIQNQRLMPNV